MLGSLRNKDFSLLPIVKLVPASSYSLLQLVPADSLILFLLIVVVAAGFVSCYPVCLECLLDLFLEEIMFISSHVFL